MFDATKKIQVTLWGKSWFDLLYAIRKSETRINVMQTRDRSANCPITPENPLGTRTITELVKSNFRNIVKEIEKQTDLTTGLNVAMNGIFEGIDTKEAPEDTIKRVGIDLIDEPNQYQVLIGE